MLSTSLCYSLVSVLYVMTSSPFMGSASPALMCFLFLLYIVPPV